MIRYSYEEELSLRVVFFFCWVCHTMLGVTSVKITQVYNLVQLLFSSEVGRLGE